jgi:tRNA (guanine37-N1)-methyltransferase
MRRRCSGRYEGIDERVRDHLATDAVSIGPYVLSGGELAAMVVATRSCASCRAPLGHCRQRRRGVVLGGPGRRPDIPHYTRPGSYRAGRPGGCCFHGDHARVREWRLEESAAGGAQDA